MAIRFLCPFGHHLVVPDNRAGKKGRCPTCQQKVIVPVPNPTSSKQDSAKVGSKVQEKEDEEEDKDDVDPWDAFVDDLIGPDRTPGGQQLGFESDILPPTVNAPVRKPSPAPTKSPPKDHPPTPPAAPKSSLPKASVPQPPTSQPRQGNPVPPPPPRRPNPPAASLAHVADSLATPPVMHSAAVPAASPAPPVPAFAPPSPATLNLPTPPPAKVSPPNVSPQAIPPSPSKTEPRLEGYRPDRDTLQTIHWLAVALVLVTVFSAVPVVQHWNLSIAPIWAQVVWLLVVCQFVYIAWLVSLPDWSTAWMGVLVFTPVAAIYGGAIAIVLSTPLGKTLALDLADVRDVAAGWSAANVMLMALMSFACGRVGSKWHRRVSLLPRSLRSTSAMSSTSSRMTKSAWSAV